MRAAVLALLGVTIAACGQRGPLYLPTDPAAKGRATLPDLLVPSTGTSAPSPAGEAGAPAGTDPAGRAAAKPEGRTP